MTAKLFQAQSTASEVCASTATLRDVQHPPHASHVRGGAGEPHALGLGQGAELQLVGHRRTALERCLRPAPVAPRGTGRQQFDPGTRGQRSRTSKRRTEKAEEAERRTGATRKEKGEKVATLKSQRF